MKKRDPRFILMVVFTFQALSACPAESITPAEPGHSYYRSTWDGDRRNPTLEVFIPNLTSSEMMWSNVWLDGVLIAEATNEVLWSQWYPSERAFPGETVVLQLSLPTLPSTNQAIEVQAATGEKLKIIASSSLTPSARITGIAFDPKIDTAYVSYSIDIRGSRVEGEGSVVSVPSKVFVNGKDFSDSVRKSQ